MEQSSILVKKNCMKIIAWVVRTKLNNCLGNNHYMPFLTQDFSDSGRIETVYRIFEPKDKQIQNVRITRLGEEQLKLAGGTFTALLLEEMNQDTGVKMKYWLDKKTGYLLKLNAPRADVFLTESGIRNEISLSNLDDQILRNTNVSIADFQSISYMKVKAQLEPSGVILSRQSLNIPGQKFIGTVNENLVEGIFEIAYKPYNGSDAPPFPADFSRVDSVRKFLMRTDIMETDDTVLVEKAQVLTAGSADCWEAAVALSQWVADSIGYALPGGISARNTYDIRKGECGAHALLLATFCRSVGIPARMVWGCMYVPNRGGAFGQHAWTEVFMGEAGWIPVDATAREIDYLDSGHIRLGDFQSLSIALNPIEFEILYYRLGSADEQEAMNDNGYEAYLGTYSGKEKLHVIVQNGKLAVNIPGKIILALHDPDEQGRWKDEFGKNEIFFEKDASGRVVMMKIDSINCFRKEG